MRWLTGCCLFLLVLQCAVGCKEQARDRLYFDDLNPPVGVGKVKIVHDESLNLPEGEIHVKAVVEPEVDRDELDRLMNSFYRQVKDRRGFLGDGKPHKIDLRFYTSEPAAVAGGEDWLSHVTGSATAKEPEIVNKQKAPLLKWARAALGKMPEYSGALQPQMLADPTTMSIELSIPFVSDDGSGKYVDQLTYVKAITEWVSYTRTLFEKLLDLRKLTFIGKHQDKPVMKIWLTRDQYTALDLQQVEESLGAFQGQFLELIMSKAISEKAVEAKVRAQRHKVYRETLARLPAEQVELDKSLR
jgi:hypothetical protein